MSHPTMFPVAYAAYFVAGGACLVAVVTVLIQLFLTDLRRGFPTRELARQEFIWTLVPALVLVGLTVIGEIPQAWGPIVAGEGAREVRLPSR